MKRIILFISISLVSSSIFSQWKHSLTFNTNETINDISAPNDSCIWAISRNFIIYKTKDGGDNWKRIKPNGLTGSLSILQLYTVNNSLAFLCTDSVGTGKGPGIVFKTSDGGNNWTRVFSHKGNCNIILAMFGENKGMLSCAFDSFNGSIKAGQNLYYTKNGGDDWKLDTINPARGTVLNFIIKPDNQIGMADYSHFYTSTDHAQSWHNSERFPGGSSAPKRYLQFEDSSYAIISSNNIIDLLIKRPGNPDWIDLHKPDSVLSGAITGLILDKNECWFSEAFDTENLYYSSDSAKTFTATVPIAHSSFQFLTKARNGHTLVGGTPSFMQGQIWINTRVQNISNNTTPQKLPSGIIKAEQ